MGRKTGVLGWCGVRITNRLGLVTGLIIEVLVVLFCRCFFRRCFFRIVNAEGTFKAIENGCINDDGSLKAIEDDIKNLNVSSSEEAVRLENLQLSLQLRENLHVFF